MSEGRASVEFADAWLESDGDGVFGGEVLDVGGQSLEAAIEWRGDDAVGRWI